MSVIVDCRLPVIATFSQPGAGGNKGDEQPHSPECFQRWNGELLEKSHVKRSFFTRPREVRLPEAQGEHLGIRGSGHLVPGTLVFSTFAQERELGCGRNNKLSEFSPPPALPDDGGHRRALQQPPITSWRRVLLQQGRVIKL